MQRSLMILHWPFASSLIMHYEHRSHEFLITDETSSQRSPEWLTTMLPRICKMLSLHWAKPRSSPSAPTIYVVQPWKAFSKIKSWEKNFAERELRERLPVCTNESERFNQYLFNFPTKFRCDFNRIQEAFFLPSICCNDCDSKEEFKRKKEKKNAIKYLRETFSSIYKFFHSISESQRKVSKRFYFR